VAVNGVLLDTSGYSHLLRGHDAVGEAVKRADRVALNPVVVGELLLGFRRGRSRKRNEELLRKFLGKPSVDLLPIDGVTAERYAAIKAHLREAGTPVPIHDVWIAASAMQHGLRVVTTDSDFLRIPQVLVDHFEAPGAAPLLRVRSLLPRRRRPRP
jgi:tRNA(fMet)-specific endonuclease VapC